MENKNLKILAILLSGAALSAGCGQNLSGTYSGTSTRTTNGTNISSPVNISLTYGGNSSISGSWQESTSGYSGSLTGQPTSIAGNVNVNATFSVSNPTTAYNYPGVYPGTYPGAYPNTFPGTVPVNTAYPYNTSANCMYTGTMFVADGRLTVNLTASGTPVQATPVVTGVANQLPCTGSVSVNANKIN